MDKQHLNDFRFVWIDVETTGLDPKKDELLELACIITDGDLHELNRWEGIFWRPLGLYSRCDPFIRKMHGEPGLGCDDTDQLFYTCEHSKLTYEKAQKDLVGLFISCGVIPGKAQLAGASVHFDRDFIKENLPHVEMFFSHRHFDTSTLTTAVDFWCKDFEIREPGTKPAHRAMLDIEESLQRARRFRALAGTP